MINETDISRLESYISGALSPEETQAVGLLLQDSKAHKEYFEFLMGLQGTSEIKSSEFDLQPATDRIMSRVHDLKSPELSSQTWQPALAAWAGVGIVVAVCVFLSRQPLSNPKTGAQKEIPSLARQSNSSPLKGEDIGGGDQNSDELFRNGTYAQNIFPRPGKVGAVREPPKRSKFQTESPSALAHQSDSSPLTLRRGSGQAGEASEGARVARKGGGDRVEHLSPSRLRTNQSVGTGTMLSNSQAPDLRSAASVRNRPSIEETPISERPASASPRDPWIVSSSGSMPIFPVKGESIQICIDIRETKKSQIEVYNLVWEKITTVFDGEAEEGTSCWNWNGKNTKGSFVAPGTYVANIVIEGQQKKLLRWTVAR